MSTINPRHTNAIVGVLKYADENGVVLVECDEVFEMIVVPARVINNEEAMILVDRTVCVFDSKVFTLA